MWLDLETKWTIRDYTAVYAGWLQGWRRRFPCERILCGGTKVWVWFGTRLKKPSCGMWRVLLTRTVPQRSVNDKADLIPPKGPSFFQGITFGGYLANIAKLKGSYLRSQGDQSQAMQKPHSFFLFSPLSSTQANTLDIYATSRLQDCASLLVFFPDIIEFHLDPFRSLHLLRI